MFMLIVPSSVCALVGSKENVYMNGIYFLLFTQLMQWRKQKANSHQKFG